MKSRARRWVEILGVSILSLLCAGVLVAGHRSSTPRSGSAYAIAYGATTHVGSPARSSSTSSSSSTSTSSTSSTTTPSTPTSTTVPALAVPATSSSVSWVEHKVTLTYQGLTRGYLLFRPAAVSATRLPVVFELAGCCVSATTEANRANFRAVAGPAILVYPEYYQENWDAGACCGSSATSGVDDVGFLTTVIRQVQADQPDAAPGPVYLAGYSNGGKMAMELACRAPTLFSAVAVYGATRTSSCTGPPPDSVLIMSGTADSEVAVGPGPPIVQNGFTEPTVTQLVTSYLTADGCGANRRTLTLGTALIGRWAGCSGGRQVGEVLYKGADHNWPEQSGATPSAQQIMWDFFVDLGA